MNIYRPRNHLPDPNKGEYEALKVFVSFKQIPLINCSNVYFCISQGIINHGIT